jgi:hypothetical protein
MYTVCRHQTSIDSNKTRQVKIGRTINSTGYAKDESKTQDRNASKAIPHAVPMLQMPRYHQPTTTTTKTPQLARSPMLKEPQPTTVGLLEPRCNNFKARRSV